MQKLHTSGVVLLTLTLAACGQQGGPSQTDTQGALQAQAASQAQFLIGFKRGSGLDRAAVRRAGGQVTHEWPELDALAARLPAAALQGLRNNPNVEYVEEDLKRYALGKRQGIADGKPGSGATTPTAAASVGPWSASGEYTWGDNALKVADLRALNHTGANSASSVAVCIGDTGIDGNHPEFQKKLKGYKNFMNDGRDSAYELNDVSHHGTHVAGTVFAQFGAGTGAGGLQSGMDVNGVGGVATGVNLYMARVLGDDGSGSSSGIINGVKWCVSQLKSEGGTEGRVVINLSLGSSRGSRTEQRAYDNAYSKGVLTVAASGNDGGAIGYPANYSSVVAVGAIDDHARLASFSNFGANQELVGPGVGVLSTVPVGAGLGASASASGVAAYSSVLAADYAAKGSVSATIVKTASANNLLCGVGSKDPTLQGRIALISRGTCSFEEKVDNAVASGALAVIIYNNTAGELGMTLGKQKSVPVVGITQQDGNNTLAAVPTSGQVSITSVDYEYFNGTSMASPHAAAAAALVWAARPSLTNTQLRNLLQSSATDLGAAGKDNSYGYGLVDPLKAITGAN